MALVVHLFPNFTVSGPLDEKFGEPEPRGVMIDSHSARPPSPPRSLSGRNEHPLRRYRRARGVTLAQFGKRVGLSKSFLSEIEAGAPCSPTAAMRISRETGGDVKVSDLIPALSSDEETPS